MAEGVELDLEAEAHKLAALQLRLGPRFAVVKAGRSRIVYEGMLFQKEGTTPITSNVREGILCDDALLLIKQEGKSQLSVVEVPLASAIVWDRFHQENWDERASPKFTFELCGDGASKCPTVVLAALDAPGKIAWMRALKSVVTALAPADKTIEPGFLHTLIRGNLWSAAYHGDEALVSQLCRHCTSAAPEEGDSGVTTLSPAAAAVPQLDINALDEEGRSALHWAAYLGHVDVARVLLEAGANIEVLDTADFSTPLHVAVTRGHLGVATLLQANGAAMETRNLMEQTPLMAALTGSSPTDTLLPVVAWLMTKGADAQAADGEGWLPIHRAAVLGVPPLIGSLVRGGADPNAWLQLQGLSGKDAAADWFSPLHLAVGGADAVGEPIPASAFNVDVVTALCAYGAHPNARAGSEGNTALHVLLGRFAEARRGGDATKAAEFMSAASRLMAFGARLDVSNGKGVTASQAAEAASCKAALEASMNLYTSKAVPASAVALMSRIAGACRAPSAPTPEVGTSSPLLSHTRCWGHLTPSWTGNDASAGCPVCGSNFTLLFRRHHCRGCGILVCHTCSSKKFPLLTEAPDSDDDKFSLKPLKRGLEGAEATTTSTACATERVCDACFNKLTTLVDVAAAQARRWEEERAKAKTTAKNFADEPLTRPKDAARDTLFAGKVAAPSAAGGAGETTARTGAVQGQLSEVRDKLALRGEKISILQDRTADMADSARNFAALTEKLKEQSKGGNSWFGF